MTTTDPLAGFGTIKTPQSRPAPDRPEQVKNNAGGYVFKIDALTQFRRFLTMGTVGGTYYVGQKELTEECGNLVLSLTQDEAKQIEAIDELVTLSLAGRAPKQNPTLFALAIFCQHGTTPAKQYARKQITKVVRTGTHLFIFVGYLKQFGGWSRGLRKAVAEWYVEKDADQLAYQLVKYRQREGYTHRDVLRMVHPKISTKSFDEAIEINEAALPNSPSAETHAFIANNIEEMKAERRDIMLKRAAIDWTVKGMGGDEGNVPEMIRAFDSVQSGSPAVNVLAKTKLPWEALPDEAMNDTKVWDKLLDNGMPVGALLRQLPRLTKLGMLPQIGGRTNEVVDMLIRTEALQKARIHPINVLIALKTYSQGHGMRSEWDPTAKMVDALDEMYYRSFGFIEPANKRTMNSVDVSASMTWDSTKPPGIPLTCREIAAAMAMVSVRTEPNQITTAFTSGSRGAMTASDGITVVPVSERQRLDDVVRMFAGMPAGGTDCSLPMAYALEKQWEIDTFVIYTDNDTWAGRVHPFQMLKQYRRAMGIDARLIVVACTPSHFSIADPTDPGMLDVSGFDSAVPQLISDFSATVI